MLPAPIILSNTSFIYCRIRKGRAHLAEAQREAGTRSRGRTEVGQILLKLAAVGVGSAIPADPAAGLGPFWMLFPGCRCTVLRDHFLPAPQLQGWIYHWAHFTLLCSLHPFFFFVFCFSFPRLLLYSLKAPKNWAELLQPRDHPVHWEKPAALPKPWLSSREETNGSARGFHRR